MWFFFFALLLPLLWGLLHWYVGRRLIRPSGLSARGRRVAWGALIVAAVLPLYTFLGARAGLPWTDTGPLPWLGSMAMGISSILLVLVVTVDVAGRLGKTARRIMSRGPGVAPEDPDRRAFLGNMVNAGVLGTTGTVGGVGVLQARQTAEVVEVEVPIEGLPPAFEGFRIVQLTDIHVGPVLRRDDLQAIVERANGLDADVMAVTGDLIDGHVSSLEHEVAPLRQLRGKYGTFFVTGNHEYYWNATQWCEHVASLGLRVLHNEHIMIERDGARLLLAGVTDHRAGEHIASHRTDAKKARGTAQADLRVLLAHQPRSVYEATDAGFDLQISGHTHGGQYFPMNLLVHLAQPYVSGLHRHGRMWIYVSRGTGFWGPPLRVGAPHEITLLRLVRA